jgi:3-methyladenine DNA glycosylase/8-oxoguanine DNA glycosylase
VPAALRPRKLPYDAQVARTHLSRRDPVMRQIIKRIGPLELELRGTPYQTLMRALLYQQLAGPAAAAIERRFLALYGDRPPEPSELLATTPERLREAGVSRQKASYLHSLAEHSTNGGLEPRKLNRLPDDDVIALVTEVKGIGRWTADMLLMFCLGRSDVLPVGDLGIQKSMMQAYGLDELPQPEAMARIAESWRPYRSAGSWYLWRSTDTITADITL